MQILAGQIAGLLEQLAQAVSVVDLNECPSIIGSLEQLKAMAWSRLTSAQAVSSAPAQVSHERYLSVEEVAERFHVTAKWLYKHKKNLPHSQPTRKTLRFPEGAIHKWFASRAR